VVQKFEGKKLPPESPPTSTAKTKMSSRLFAGLDFGPRMAFTRPVPARLIRLTKFLRQILHIQTAWNFLHSASWLQLTGIRLAH